jgi:hypothetical protein
MAEGGWAVLGAIVGSLGSLLATWLTLRGKPDYFDKRAMQFLKKKLEQERGGLPWQKISALGKSIGLKEHETRELLFLIGAEPCDNPPDQWRLVE